MYVITLIFSTLILTTSIRMYPTSPFCVSRKTASNYRWESSASLAPSSFRFTAFHYTVFSERVLSRSLGQEPTLLCPSFSYIHTSGYIKDEGRTTRTTINFIKVIIRHSHPLQNSIICGKKNPLSTNQQTTNNRHRKDKKHVKGTRAIPRQIEMNNDTHLP